MRFNYFAPAALCILTLIRPVTLAFETDQYNLPPVPLVDIGEEVMQYVEDGVMLAAARVNARIDKSRACIDALPAKLKGCGSPEFERNNLEYLRSNDALSEEVYKLLGAGDLFVTSFGNWMRSHKFSAEPSSYKTSYGESIYIAHPFDYLTISPTVRLYGTEFGVDKLEHMFQQGYKYYTIRRDALGKGMTMREADQEAVKWGQRTERTYFGMMVSGVYSNADLYSNYAGMKFYEGLTEQIAIGNKTRPATFSLSGGSWTFDTAATRESLLRPFLTDHLNEALNPSDYAFNLIPTVRRSVRKYACSEWKAAFPMLSADEMTSRTRSLELWYGKDYGFTKQNRSVTIAKTCLDPASRDN